MKKKWNWKFFKFEQLFGQFFWRSMENIYLKYYWNGNFFIYLFTDWNRKIFKRLGYPWFFQMLWKNAKHFYWNFKRKNSVNHVTTSNAMKEICWYTLILKIKKAPIFQGTDRIIQFWNCRMGIIQSWNHKKFETYIRKIFLYFNQRYAVRLLVIIIDSLIIIINFMISSYSQS